MKEEIIKKLILICMMFSVLSCATTTEILRGDDVIWSVNSKSDAIVTYKKGDEEFTVDNRGRASFMETVFGTLFMKTDINVGGHD